MNKFSKKLNTQSKTFFHYSDVAYKITFAVIFITFISVRVWKFGSIPGGLNYDEAMSAVDAKAIADYGTDHYGMKNPVMFQAWKRGQQSAMLGYMMAFFIKIFGFNMISIRLPMLVMSVAGAVCLTLLVKDLFGKNCALVAAFILAINPWHIMQGRWALDANMLPHFFIIGLYFLNKGFSKTFYFYIASGVFGLSMYCYGMSVYIVTIFLMLFAIYVLIFKKISIKNLLISIGVYVVISWPFFLCLMVNLFKWDTINLGFITIPRFYETARENDMIFFVKEPMKQLSTNVVALYNTLIKQKTDLLPNMINGFGLFYYFSIPAAILGIVQLFIQKDNRAKAMISFALISCIICGLITPMDVAWRLATVYYIVIILIGLGIYFIISKLRKIGAVSIGIYAIAFCMFVSVYFTTYAKDIERYFFSGFKDIFLAVLMRRLNIWRIWM